MPYPPAKTYQQTAPGTALDPQRNAIAGGVGNAHTIMGTTPGQISASAMNPYNAPSYDLTLSSNTDGGREIVGTSWSATATMNVTDATGGGTGRDATDTLVGLSFPGVNLTTCSAATLTFEVTAEVTPGTIAIRGESQAAGASAQYASGNLPSTKTMVASQPTTSTAVGIKSINVTTLVQQIMATANWASGNRLNITLEAFSANANCTIGNEAAGNLRLQITG